MKTPTTIIVFFFFAFPPFLTSAKSAPADTLGTTVSRIHKITQTTVYVEKSVDSMDGQNRISMLTYDTLQSVDTNEEIKTEHILKSNDYWQLGSEFSIGVNQVAFSNWAAGGVPSYSILFSNKSFAYYRKGSSLWKTDFDLKYGLQQQGEDPWFKNNDQIKLYSSYGFKASNSWNYTTLLDFKTQLAKGYASANAEKDAFVSRAFSPTYLTYSIGMEYENQAKTASIFLTPIAYKLTYVSDTSLGVYYGILPNEHTFSQFGPMAVLINKHQITPYIALNSKLNLLANVLEMEEQFVSMEWNLGLNIKLTRHLSVNILMDLLYDPKVMFDKVLSDGTIEKVRRFQLRESVFFNFVYKITN